MTQKFDTVGLQSAKKRDVITVDLSQIVVKDGQYITVLMPSPGHRFDEQRAVVEIAVERNGTIRIHATKDVPQIEYWDDSNYEKTERK